MHSVLDPNQQYLQPDYTNENPSIHFVCFVLLLAESALAQRVYTPPPPNGPPEGYRPGYYPGYHYGRRVVQASYGRHGRYVDVTEIVRRYARDRIRFKVSNE
ncbi:MAG: hypothetical protein JOY96_01255, partial [Verrucomicrobia bacterium]|nr:hypothetical protein [Verrucomicrobiota bacterium]